MRIAVLTGQADEMVEQRARSAGASVYLAKPISGGDLVRVLRRLSGRRPAAVGVA
jgi:CheY-like chemotaxis protein